MSRPDRRLAPYIFFNLKGGRQQQADGSYSLYNKYEAAFCALTLSLTLTLTLTLTLSLTLTLTLTLTRPDQARRPCRGGV